jgi:hypothetical protein
MEYADLWVTDRWMCKIEQACHMTQEEVCGCDARGHIEDMGDYCAGTLFAI